MKGGVAGKACLITGAAGGIGRETALAAASKGAKLVLTDIQAEPLERTAEDARARGGDVLHAEAFDITDHAAVMALAEKVHAEHGPLDVVMNIAGTSTWGSVDRLKEEHYRKLVEIDLMGPIHVIEAFVPPIVKAGKGGHLVNVSSAAGLFGLPWHTAYSAAKFGLRGVSEVLRFDLEPFDIGVSLVCPGAVHTPLVGTIDIVGVDKEHRSVKKLTDRFVSRATTPEHVADCILKAVEKNKYLVFTSHEIHALALAQRYFPPSYNLVMRIMNRQLVKVGERASTSA